MTDKFTCPRRIAEGHHRSDSPLAYDGPNLDEWRHDKTCSYDGSINPDEFMEYVRGGGEVGPTDKHYKFYVDGYSGVTQGAKKFYTHHLSEEQGREFGQLWRDGKINWGYPGQPYVPLYIPGMGPKENS